MGLKKGPSVSNYMLIKPKEVTFIQIIRLLFSSTLKNINFIETSPEEGEKLRDFWFKIIIAASAIAQKFLGTIRLPMSKIGNLTEILLNLLTLNGGLFKLLTNVMTGKAVLPTPVTAASVIGNLDTRVDLDKSIAVGDDKYMGALAMMAAKLAYENAAFVAKVVQLNWKMQFLNFNNYWNDDLKRSATQAFMFKDKLLNANLVMVAFRGTEPFSADDWISDIDLSFYEIPNVGKIHRGFAKALGIVQGDKSMPSEIAQESAGSTESEGLVNLYAYFEIVRLLKLILTTNPNAKFVVTGHSLGGGLAVQFVAALAMHEEAGLLAKLAGFYTYGQPRAGDEQFGKYMSEKIGKYNLNYKRYVYSFDLVPRIPFDDNSFLYKHFGKCVYFDSHYNGKVLQEVPDKNYFSLVWFFRKHLNAIYEVIRGFMLPRKYGSDYKEGWFQFLYRLFGIIIPGIAAHGPQDYVNSTRLGTVTSFTGSDDDIKILMQ